MTVDYSIVIPAYNEEGLLPAALASVAASMPAAHPLAGEVIVADNASTDRTAEVAREAGATVVYEPHRQIARARNAGAAAAEGHFLIFLDADTTVSPRLIARTLHVLEGGEVCGGGTCIAFDRKPPPGAAFMVRLWNGLAPVFRWAAGSYVFCRREAFEAVGGFDERYYVSEELHFSRALTRWGRGHGYRTMILDEPAVTSGRKLEWFRARQIVRTFVRLGLRPSLMRGREGLGLWYDRPEDKV